MPGLIQQPQFKTITVKELHPTFGAEIQGVDFDNLPDEQFNEIKAALAKYGFAVFRNTNLTDDAHVAFSHRLGELDNIRRYLTPGRALRYTNLELFDASNLDGDGEIVPSDSPRAHYNKGNAMFHVDSSFNPRRASYSALRAVAIPPRGQGGDTDFADSRTAWDDLDDATKQQLLVPVLPPPSFPSSPSCSHDQLQQPQKQAPAQAQGEKEMPLVGAHSLNHSRKVGSPAFFADLDVEATAPTMARHRIAQVHEPSGRMNLYIGAHLHHIVGMDRAQSDALIKKLNEHATRPQYVTRVSWEGPGDMIIWDNRAVLHRATGGPFEDRYKRDMRRTTVHDDGAFAWGENQVGERMPGFDSYSKPSASSVASVTVKE